MAKGHSRELTDPFQNGSKGGVPAFLRKKRFMLFVLAVIGMVWVYATRAPAVRTKEHELEDLLQFFVAAPDTSLPVDIDPSAELSRKSLVGAAAGRSATVPPVVVFSKTYCPYLHDWEREKRFEYCDSYPKYRFSKRAKNLLSSLNLKPVPYVIEVDLRSDSDIVKALLTRLTGHGTFPNILVRHKSIGGSDDLAQLHENGELIPLLATAGVKAGVA